MITNIRYLKVLPINHYAKTHKSETISTNTLYQPFIAVNKNLMCVKI